MIIKNVPKKSPADQPQVQLSGVKDGDVYHHAILTNKLQMVANSEPGVTTTIEIAPLTPPVPATSVDSTFPGTAIGTK